MGKSESKPLGANNYKNEVFKIDQNIKEQAYEQEVLLLRKFVSPLTEKEMYYKDININFHGDNYLHTLFCCHEQRDKKEILVFLHGYQGNSLSFYKIMPLIHEKFTSYAPDLIGMGLSSRPNIEFTSPEMCNDFFVESIEAWRQAMGLEKFYLCGHSVGGYFALIYALKYPQYIKDIILFAPSCVTDTSKGGDVHSSVNIGQKIGFRSISSLWSFQPRLQSITQNFMLAPIINFTLKKRYNISPEESEITAKITELTFKYPKDTDQCIYYIFKHPIPTAQIPVEDEIEKKLEDKRILFCFGETDWMEKIGPERLCKKDPKRFKLYIISKFGHTFPLDSPNETSKIILEHLIDNS